MLPVFYWIALIGETTFVSRWPAQTWPPILWLCGGAAVLIGVAWFVWRAQTIGRVFVVGIEVEGWVTERLPGTDRTPDPLAYEYSYGGKVYRRAMSHPPNRKQAWPEGAQLRLLVDPRKPSRAFILDKLD